MFKSEEAMKMAINVIEQTFGDDRWGVGAYFDAAEAVMAPEGPTWRTYVAGRLFTDRDRSCSIGAMASAVDSAMSGIKTEGRPLGPAINRLMQSAYGLTPADVAIIIGVNDSRGHEATIKCLRETIGHV